MYIYHKIFLSTFQMFHLLQIGRTMDFTFDLSQTPVIGRRWLIRQGVEEKSLGSPLCSMSLSPADNSAIAGWKRPWMSQVQLLKCSNVSITIIFV